MVIRGPDVTRPGAKRCASGRAERAPPWRENETVDHCVTAESQPLRFLSFYRFVPKRVSAPFATSETRASRPVKPFACVLAFAVASGRVYGDTKTRLYRVFLVARAERFDLRGRVSSVALRKEGAKLGSICRVNSCRGVHRACLAR
jgi:hypothetical protein